MQEKYIQSRLNGNLTNSCKWEVIFFYSCCTLSAVVIFIEAFESFSYDIWVDEAFSLRMIEHSWFEIVQLTAMDVHPPLYYFILKLGVGITHNISGIPIIVCAKLVSVMPILILWIMNVLYIRPRYGKCVAGMFSLCITAAPNLTAYSVDIRMYGWGLLFVTATWNMAGSVLSICGWVGAKKPPWSPCRISRRNTFGSLYALFCTGFYSFCLADAIGQVDSRAKIPVA